MRIQLRDLAPGQDYALQFRSNDGAGHSSDWSQVQRFTTTDDTTRPGDVLNLQFFTSGGSYIATWDKTVVDEFGAPLKDFRCYHVAINDGAISHDFYVVQERFELTKDLNAATFGTFQTNLTVSVWAVDMTYNESPQAATLTLNADTPPTPSTPGVQNYLGLLAVTWDGNDSAGNPAPTNTQYVEVHVSQTSGFTPSSSTLVGTITIGQGRYVVPGLTYGTTYYVKLVLVNLLNKKSSPSGQASGVPQKISGTTDINFTAKDIGGANAYYKSSQPTSADGNLKAGDIWYDTSNHYTTYRYDGAAWQPAPEIGVIAGTKILAGTLTSDAVGTNLLITSSANIGTAVIDSANIASVSAGIITAGTMSADVEISGRFTTALTGARREMNATGFQAWDASNNQTINLDGINNLLTGTFQTSLTGRRIELAAGDSAGIIQFDSGGTYTGHVWSYTESNGTVESLQMGMPIVSTPTIWNSVHLNSQQWSQYCANRHTFTFGGASGAGGTDSSNPGFFNIFSTNNYGGSSTARFQIDKDSLIYYDSAGHGRINSTASEFFVYDHAQNTRIWIDSGDNNNFSTRIYPGGGSNGFIEIGPAGGTQSAWFRQWSATQPGNVIFGSAMITSADTSAGAGIRVEFKEYDGSSWIPLWASGFQQQSDEATKENISEYAEPALPQIRNTKVKKYRYKPGPNGLEKPEQIGLIAQEAPDSIRAKAGDGKAIELYQMISLLWKAVQELDDTINVKKG